MKTKDCYTELAIQIATLDMKLDKILELLNTPEIEYEIVQKVEVSDEEYFGEVYK